MLFRSTRIQRYWRRTLLQRHIRGDILSNHNLFIHRKLSAFIRSDFCKQFQEGGIVERIIQFALAGPESPFSSPVLDHLQKNFPVARIETEPFKKIVASN